MLDEKTGLTPEERVLRARLAAHSMHARNDSKKITAPARKAFLERFEHEVDPERRLHPEERGRRAEHALRAHMSRLALRSARTRRRGSSEGTESE